MPDWDSIYSVSGTDFTSTDTANLVNITGLSAPLAPSSRYEFEVVLVGQSSTTAGITLDMNFSAAGAVGNYNGVGSGGTTAGVVAAGTLGVGQGSVYWTTATTDESAYIKGEILTGANSGNLTARVKKLTGGTATIYIGSLLKVKLMP